MLHFIVTTPLINGCVLISIPLAILYLGFIFSSAASAAALLSAIFCAVRALYFLRMVSTFGFLSPLLDPQRFLPLGSLLR